jgi:hypothetical protein
MRVEIMVSYHSEYLNQDNEEDWEALNRASPYGSCYHDLRWKRVMERSFNYKSRYFLVYDGKDPVALCPFFIEKVRGLKSLTSLPSADLKHIVITEPSNQAIMKEILVKSIEIAKKDMCAFIIFVNSGIESIESVREVCSVNNWKTVPFSINGYLALDLEKNDPTYIWNNVFNSKESQRKYIRRFEQSGFNFRESSSQEDLDTFYEYYSQNLIYIGATPFNRSHFNIIFDIYSKELRMTFLEKDGEMAGGVIAILDPQKKIMHLRYMALNRDMANTYHPTYAIYWEAVNKAYELGYRGVCFGTNAKDEQNKSYRIKKGFGCEYINNYAELMPMNPLYSLFYKVYQYL